MVYIRIKADISALTSPNKRQPVCCPALTGGGATAGGDRVGRKSDTQQRGEYKGLKLTGTRRSVPAVQLSYHLSPSQRENTSVSA